MDAFVLLGSFALLMLIGMPVAYALGLAALIGAVWIELPIDAVMIQIASGVNKFSLLAIPFFVLAGAIMAEGRHGAAAGRLRRCAGRASCAAACRW
jgi:TRAP-type mannitol/chloroaromatic compound transport system permease large subunit